MPDVEHVGAATDVGAVQPTRAYAEHEGDIGGRQHRRDAVHVGDREPRVGERQDGGFSGAPIVSPAGSGGAPGRFVSRRGPSGSAAIATTYGASPSKPGEARWTTTYDAGVARPLALFQDTGPPLKGDLARGGKNARPVCAHVGSHSSPSRALSP